MSNNTYRDYLIKNIIFDNTYEETELDDQSRCYLCADKLKKMSKVDNTLVQGLYEALISTIYIDAYKVLNLKEKELSIGYMEQIDFDNIKFITNIDDLKELINNDPLLLEVLLNYFLEFYRMNYFRKIIAFKALGTAREYNLKLSFNIFQNDIEDYSDNLSLDTITNYAKKEVEVLRKTKDESETYDNLISKVLGFLYCLNRDDVFTFTEFFKEILEIDYKWIRYITDKKLKCDWLIDEELMYRMELYEDNDMDSLVAEGLCDNDYFEQLIDSFLYIKCDNMGIDERVINEEVVDEYYNKIRKKMKRERD